MTSPASPRSRGSDPARAQRSLRAIFGAAVRVFYQRESFGERVPGDGPLLVVANHPNGLIDPILLAETTRRTVRFLGKAPLFGMPVIGSIMRGFRALPVYRAQDGADTAQNERTFEAVYAALRAGDLVCLFPEGKSHDEPTLQKLKTGAARMALGAERSAEYALGVRIVPVGLVYRAKRRFRSRVATCVGAPIRIDDLGELHASDEREAVRVLNERIAAGLSDVTLRLDRWEDLPLIELAAQLLRPSEGQRLTHVHEFADRVHAIRREHPGEVAELTDRVSAFRSRLARLGLGPDELHARYPARAVVRFCLSAIVRLALALPLALVGAVFWFVPYVLAPLVPRMLRASRDTHATVQVLAGLVFFPTWLAIACGVAFVRTGTATALAIAVLAPALGLLALAYRDWRREARADASAFLRLVRRKRLRELLVRERDELTRDMERLRDRAE